MTIRGSHCVSVFIPDWRSNASLRAEAMFLAMASASSDPLGTPSSLTDDLLFDMTTTWSVPDPVAIPLLYRLLACSSWMTQLLASVASSMAWNIAPSERSASTAIIVMIVPGVSEYT